MRKEDFAEILSDINENYVKEAGSIKKSQKSVWLKWGAMAACLCLLAAAATPRLFPEVIPVPPDGTDSSTQTTPSAEYTESLQTPWTVHFNQASSMVSADRIYVKGYFTEALSDAELASLEPGTRFAHMTCSGHAGFDHSGNLLDIVLSVTASLPESPVTVAITREAFSPCYLLSGEAIVSICENVAYTVYQYASDGNVTLAADAVINGLYFHFATNAPKSRLDQVKADFQDVLAAFACYEENAPDLSVITPEEIPELTEQIFSSLSEAQAEPDFGQYLPTELPAGFAQTAIRRFQFLESNYLSGMWSKGLDDLVWVVSPYTEADAHRLTGVADKENYDLSLYPIPRADSVPDALHEIVNDPIFKAEELTLDAVYCRAYKVKDAGDSDGWRMNFSVKYGDIVIEVHAKGVDPEWVYQQLATIKNTLSD